MTLSEYLANRPVNRASADASKIHSLIAVSVEDNKQGPNHRHMLANNISPKNAERILDRWRG